MPDDTGAITAGQDDVQNNPSPVFQPVDERLPGGLPTGGPVPISGANITPPASPTTQPSFFRRLLFSLGKGLLEGTQAGLEAPMNAQGPSVAAATAPNIPVQAAQRQAEIAKAQAVPQQIATTKQLQDMNVAVAQLKLHQLQSIALTLPASRQEAMYRETQQYVRDAIKAKVYTPPLATGTAVAMQQEFSKRQADAKATGQKLLPLQIVPNPTGGFEDDGGPSMALVMNEKGLVESDTPSETWGAAQYSDDPVEQKNFKDAGVGEFRWPGIKAGMDTQQASKSYIDARLKWHAQVEKEVAAWVKNKANLESKETEGQKNRASREAINTNNVRRSAAKDLIAANTAGDRIAANLLGKVVSASAALARLQDELKNKAESAWTSSEARSVDTATRTLKEAQGAYDDYKAGRNKPAAKGPLPSNLAPQYMQKAGGDPKKAAALARADGYDVPKGKSE